MQTRCAVSRVRLRFCFVRFWVCCLCGGGCLCAVFVCVCVCANALELFRVRAVHVNRLCDRERARVRINEVDMNGVARLRSGESYC